MSFFGRFRSSRQVSAHDDARRPMRATRAGTDARKGTPAPEAARANELSAARRIAELTESRRAIAEAFEIERHRIERDLHDGSQQYLVAGMMKLGELQLQPAVEDDPELRGLVDDALEAVSKGLESLRRTVRGIHPKALEEAGLASVLEDRAADLGGDIRIVCPTPLPTLPEGVLAIAYFFASEAMTNAAKYAPGTPVSVLLVANSDLHVTVVDQGAGGAVLRPGHGLAGMRERLAAVGGTLRLASPAGGPTQVQATIPLLLRRGEPGLPEASGEHL